MQNSLNFQKAAAAAGPCAARDSDRSNGVTWKWASPPRGPMTAGPTYDFLPGKVCCCPHYGYVFKGRIRCVFPGTDWPDEVANAGDVYFFRAGHHLIYEEATEALELNPADALEFLMDHVEAYARKFAEKSDSK